MANAASVLTRYVLERMQSEPIDTRIELARALAAMSADKTQAALLNQMADELEAVQRRHKQLVLDFRRRTEGGAS